MKQILVTLSFCFICAHATKQAQPPFLKSTKDGKSVYVPVAPSVDVNKEMRLQQEDQNQTKRGGRNE